MYELPTSIAFYGPSDDGLWGQDHIYSAWAAFLNTFLRDWASQHNGVRTENPWEANLFYVPAFTYAYSGNAGPWVSARLNAHLHSVVRYIRAAYPWWERHGGRDHFVWLTNDRGACSLAPHLAPLIKITHWGYSRHNQSFFADVVNKQYGCHNPVKDVVAAPVWHDSAGLAAVHAYHDAVRAARGADPNRTLLLFFAGGSRPDLTYSGGVRQDVAAYLSRLSPAPPDVVYLTNNGTSAYRTLLGTAVFCLTPYGYGWGVRVVIAMTAGCIPLIIQDGVHQPYEDLLPYADFSLRLARTDIPRLLDILRAVPQEERDALRFGMAQHYRSFMWGGDGTAYNATIASLGRRLHNMRADYYR